MTAKKHYPLESFGPEMLASLLKGAREELTIEFPSFRTAIHFIARIHHLRSTMRQLHHEMYPLAAKARCSLRFGEEAGYEAVEIFVSKNGNKTPVNRDAPAKVIISPNDSEFTKALEKAGVTVDAHTEVPPPSTTTPTTDSSVDSILDSYLPEK